MRDSTIVRLQFASLTVVAVGSRPDSHRSNTPQCQPGRHKHQLPMPDYLIRQPRGAEPRRHAVSGQSIPAGTTRWGWPPTGSHKPRNLAPAGPGFSRAQRSARVLDEGCVTGRMPSAG